MTDSTDTNSDTASTKKNVCTYLPQETIDMVDAYATRHSMTKAAVYDKAIQKLTDGPDWQPLLIKRLEKLETRLAKQNRDFEAFAETLYGLAYHIFVFQPPLSKSSRRAAKQRAKKRLESLTDAVTDNLRGGKTFLDTVRDAARRITDFPKTGT